MGRARSKTSKTRSKSKSTSASRRAARKATGQAAQKAGKYKSVKSSDAAKRARSRASERRKKAAKRAALSKSAGERGRGVAVASSGRGSGRGSVVERPGARTASTSQRRALSRSAGEKGRGVSASRTVSGGRGNVVERPGARTASVSQRRALSRSAGERGRGVPTSRGAVAGGRGRTVERPGERAAALAAQRRSSGKSRSNANKQAAQSLLGAGYRNVAGDKNRSTIGQQFMSGIRNLMRGETGFVIPGSGTSGRTAKQQAFHDSIHGADARRKRRRRRKDSGGDQVVPPKPTPEIDDFGPELPPEIVDEFPPVMPPQFPQYPGYGGGMMGGLGAFGYNPALMAFESQQGAGQVPYYMAAARNAQTPNMSPAFMHAARNYDILGGMQRTAPRPMEMMSAAERAEIANINSNFNTPNYNSPYLQNQGARDFDYFRKMVSSGGAGQPADYAPIADMFPGGPPARFGGPGKGASRPMSQEQAMAMRSGIMGML